MHKDSPNGDGYGYILTKVVGLGWVKSGQAVPMEMYTPEVVQQHVLRVREFYKLPVDRYVRVEVPDLVLMDEDGLEEHYRGETRLHWRLLGDVYPYGIRDAEPVKGLIRLSAMDVGIPRAG